MVAFRHFQMCKNPRELRVLFPSYPPILGIMDIPNEMSGRSGHKVKIRRRHRLWGVNGMIDVS
jgi:hypothetical protein